MGKRSEHNTPQKVSKQTLHGTKNHFIKKDKKPKFKNTPTGKVALIDKVKEQNKNMSPQKNGRNTNVKNNHQLTKERLKPLDGKENSPKEKQSSPMKKQALKRKQTSSKLQNKQDNKKNNLSQEKEKIDSDSDIDEGIIPQEEISMVNESLEDEEESDSDVPDILGETLPENSDVDDEDFEDEEKDENEQEENSDNEDSFEDIDDNNMLVINMFKGIKSNIKDEDLEESYDDEEEEEEDESEDDSNYIESDEHNMDSSLLTSNEDDEDEVEEEDNDDEVEEEEDDDDEVEEEEDDDEVEEEGELSISHFKALLGKSMTDDDDDIDEDFNEEEEDDDDDDDDEEDEEKEDVSYLKALLGNSMTDEDDDADFNEEDEDDEDEDDEDDDISDEEESDEDLDTSIKVDQEKKKANITSIVKDSSIKNEQNNQVLTPEEQKDLNKRTIFIDNIPIETKESSLKKGFSQYGVIENLRFRNLIPKDSKTSKKVAAITKQFHQKATTAVVYITYKLEESAKKALCMNGKKFEGNYINVKIVAIQEKHDSKKSVFLGNLKFGK